MDDGGDGDGMTTAAGRVMTTAMAMTAATVMMMTTAIASALASLMLTSTLTATGMAAATAAARQRQQWARATMMAKEVVKALVMTKATGEGDKRNRANVHQCLACNVNLCPICEIKFHGVRMCELAKLLGKLEFQQTNVDLDCQHDKD